MWIKRTQYFCISRLRIRGNIQYYSIGIFFLYFFQLSFFIFYVYHNSKIIKIYNISFRNKCFHQYFGLVKTLFRFFQVKMIWQFNDIKTDFA